MKRVLFFIMINERSWVCRSEMKLNTHMNKWRADKVATVRTVMPGTVLKYIM